MNLIIAGSNSQKSINQRVSQELTEILKYNYYDTRQINIPVFCRDDVISSELDTLFNLIENAKKIVFVIPEYNGNYSSFFKNIIDILTIKNIELYHDKDIVLVCVTPGPAGGKSVLSIAKTMFTHFNAKTIHTFSLGNYESIKKSYHEIKRIAHKINKI